MGNHEDWLDRMGICIHEGDYEKINLDGLYSSEYIEQCGLECETTFGRLKELMLWGTYGKEREFWPNHRYVRLIDCDTEHLENIALQTNLDDLIIRVIDSILEDRYNT